MRSNTKCYGDSDTTAPSGRELYHLQFSLQAAIPEFFGYTLLELKCNNFNKFILVIRAYRAQNFGLQG